ncbi:MAG: hypothetical protein K0Q94_122 [Paenibacillus sp.]|uniref:hypothetical protein n=1 Tax=Paenibacillus sp. GCM10012303 TaxID=3317340 RepID=UPI0029F1D9A5|nr:hypothetical protein [Paenibacillus sp.]
MFKNKGFVYGLGIGLIAGAVMLQLMFKVDEMENRTIRQGGPAAVDQLQAEADKLNYKVVPKDQKTYSDKDIEAIRQKTSEEERSKLAAQPVPQQVPPKTVSSVYITEQMNAYHVADMLLKANLIADSNGFVTTLRDKKLTTRIRAGSYSFEGGASVDDIISRITIANP